MIRINGVEHDLSFDLRMSSGKVSGELVLNDVQPGLMLEIMQAQPMQIDVLDLGIRANVCLSFVSATHANRLDRQQTLVLVSYDATFTMSSYESLKE